MLTDRLIVLSWAIFCGYWALGSLSARASIGRNHWLRWYLPVRFIVPAVALGYVALVVRKLPQHDSPVVGVRIMGAVLCTVGVAIAIRRACLGDSWGMPMTQREIPHLVTNGPYACVRHPIYSGVLLGIIGTMLAINPTTLLGWPLIALAFFGISAIKEERDMLKIFPEQYRAYMSRTKRFIPFVW